MNFSIVLLCCRIMKAILEGCRTCQNDVRASGTVQMRDEPTNDTLQYCMKSHLILKPFKCFTYLDKWDQYKIYKCKYLFALEYENEDANAKH